MANYTPTANVTIDKEETQPVAPEQLNPTEIFKLAGASFGVGVIVGGMLVFAFSKSAVESE